MGRSQTRVLLVLALSFVAALFGAPRTAQAIPLSGSITLVNSGNPQGSPGWNWNDATGVIFFNPFTIQASSGDYSGLAPGGMAFFGSFLWGSGSGAVSVSIPTTLWMPTVGGATYTLSNATVTNILRGESDSISVSGTASLAISGAISRDLTVGSWTYTAGESRILTITAGSQEPEVSVETIEETIPNPPGPEEGPAAVPEPASLGLLALGSVSLSWIARRRKLA